MKRYQKCLALTVSAVMLLCTAPATAAPADDLHVSVAQLYEQASEGWHETYEAYGRTVTVDLPVQVPQTDTLPALTAVLMPRRTPPRTTTETKC